MRLGLILPVVEPGGKPLGPRSLANGAARAERLGFDGCWVFDAIGRGFILPDPLIALSAAATATERIELGTSIVQVPLRRPVELAHRVLTAQLVCGGRLVLGVGAGSTERDYDAVGVPFAQRFRLLTEGLEVMRRMWADESVLTPWPEVAGGPPVLIGSWGGGRWVRRAAREFDGWIASAANASWERLEDGIRRFHEAGGKRAVVTNVQVDLRAGRPEEDTPSLRCEPGLARERLARLRELGFDDVVLLSFEHTEDNLETIRALA